MGETDESRGRVAVLAPSPILTVTIETGDSQGPEIHYHAGGQGLWVARMAANLGADVVLCTALAGEAGRVLAPLLPGPGIEVRSIDAAGRSGSYVHDRRGGERSQVAMTQGPRFGRHDADALYGVMLTAALESDVAVLTGPQPHDALASDFYRRLAIDLHTNGCPAVADLTDGALKGALAGEVLLLKISEEELVSESGADAAGDPLTGLRALHEAGAANIALTRGPDPCHALIEGRHYEIEGPRLEALDPIGTGDSMFAAIAVSIARGEGAIEALKHGVAAGALNVTRHGLGTGRREEIERLRAHVSVRELGEPAGGPETVPAPAAKSASRTISSSGSTRPGGAASV